MGGGILFSRLLPTLIALASNTLYLAGMLAGASSRTWSGIASPTGSGRMPVFRPGGGSCSASGDGAVLNFRGSRFKLSSN